MKLVKNYPDGTMTAGEAITKWMGMILVLVMAGVVWRSRKY